MANIRYAFYKRFNGTDWDTIYFKAPASAISEVTDKRFLTDAQQTNVNAYLFSFNAANKLLKLDGSGKIPSAQIPFTIGDYLKKDGSTVMTGGLNINPSSAAGTITFKGKGEVKGDLNGVISIKTNTSPNTVANIEFTDGDMNLNGRKLHGVGAPVMATDAATRGYVDGLVAKGTRVVEAVQAATTTTGLTLSGTPIVDGYQTAIGQRVLVKDHDTLGKRGIYEVKSDAWTRIADDSVEGVLVFVEHGTVNNDSSWYVSAPDTWIKYSQVDLFEFSSEFNKSGNTISLADGKVLNKHISASAGITINKLAEFTSLDQTPFSALDDADTSKTLEQHIWDLYSAIKSLRGTGNYNTDNSQTLTLAYSEIATKNTTYEGSSAPSNSGYVTGDVYIHYEVTQP